MAGLEQIIAYMKRLKFTDADIEYLRTKNCFSDVEICSSSTNTELGYSGFIGYSKNKDGQAANVIMTGCGYDGKMIPESEDAVPFGLLQPTGAFIGFSEGSAAFTDCLCLSDAGSFRSRVPAAFAYGITPTVTNSYYMSDCFSSKGQGIRGYYTHVGDGLTVDFGEAEKIYDVSGIERHESGLVYKGEMIAPSGTSVSFTAEADDGYRLTKIMVGSTVLISDADDVYSFNMLSGDVTINGEFELLNMWGGGGTELSPYIINSTDDWNKLRLCPQYFDCHFKLNADITVDEMIGSSEHPFTGYFDGNGHTMTLNITNDSDGSAPFRWVGGNHATIENLKIDGSITTNKRYAAGIIARLSGGSANIRRCRVSADFNVSYSNEGTHGGFVGAASDNSSLTIEGCVFDGKITDNGSTVNINSSGGFVGWMDGTAKLTNCLFMPLQLRLKTTDNSESGRNYTFVRSSSGASITLDNCYYTEALEVAQGTKGYTVTPGDHFTLNFGKFTKRYPVVKLFTFEKGSMDVTLTLENADEGQYTISGGESKSFKDGDKVTLTPTDGGATILELTAENKSGLKTYEKLAFYKPEVFEVKKGEKIYFEKPSDWDDEINVYIYNESGEEIGDWPGTAMTKEADGKYSYTFEKDWSSPLVIFNDGDKIDSVQYPAERGLKAEKDKTYNVE